MKKITKIVRLTVAEQSDAIELSTVLIDQASCHIKRDKNVSRVFIYTSKIHGRLYRKMGIPRTRKKSRMMGGVLIKFNRNDIVKVASTRLEKYFFINLHILDLRRDRSHPYQLEKRCSYCTTLIFHKLKMSLLPLIEIKP